MTLFPLEVREGLEAEVETLVARQPADAGLSWLEPLLGSAPFPSLSESVSRGFLVKSPQLIPSPALPLWTCFLPSLLDQVRLAVLGSQPPQSMNPRREEGGAFVLVHCRYHCLDVLSQLLGEACRGITLPCLK